MICSNCGAENRDSAKFCTKCAAQLVPLWPVTVQMEEPSPRKRKRRRASRDSSASLHPAPGGPRLGLYLFTGLLLAAVTGWAIYAITSQMASQRDVPAVAAASAPAPASARASEALVPAALVLPASSAPVAMASAAGAAAPAPGASSADSALAPLAPPAPKSQTRKTPRPPAPTPPPVVQEAEPAPAAPPPPPPAPAASRPAPPAPPATLCGDSQLFAHSICLQRECARPGMRQHPQCVRMREQQQVLRAGSGEQ